MTSLVRQGLNEIDENQPPQLLRGGNLERQQADEASGDSHRPPCLGSEKSYFSKEVQQWAPTHHMLKIFGILLHCCIASKII